MRLLLTLLISAIAAWPEPPPPAVKMDRPPVRIPFWLSDGSPVTSDVLKVRLNGKPVKISHLSDASGGLLLLVILDWSGDISLVDPARDALAAYLSKLPPNVEVALLRAQDGLKVLLDPGADTEAVAAKLKELTVSGRAGLLDAIEPVQILADGIAAKTRARVAAVYVTDSSIYNYREDYTNPVVNSSDGNDMSRRFPEGLIQEKIRKLQATVRIGETPLFLVHLNYQSDRLNTAYQTGLMDLAVASGGSAEFCRSLAEIPSAIEKVMRIAVSHNSVEVEWQPGKMKQADVVLEAEGRSLRFRQRRQWKAGK